MIYGFTASIVSIMAYRETRRRWGIVIVTLVALVLATGTRQWAARQRGERNLSAQTPLSRMNSYALALLLGGLRGPLVMFLWPSSEGQKSEKNLEDFDTKVEWIRLLQAEFDTVHIFQIWNKAYNISVLMANLPNKYATILDALEYARTVDRERPGNINIQAAIAGIFGEKLGASNPEKTYYKQRVRDESMARGEAQDTQRGKSGAPGFRRTELDPMLDRDGNILPDLLKPRAGPGGAESEPGELANLQPFEPFPYGISAHALGYNYYKRAQTLLRNANQHHAQLSDLVVDSRPALALRSWSEDEWELGRRAELEAFGIPFPEEAKEERRYLEGPAARIALDAKVVNPGALEKAIFEYGLAAKTADAALRDYEAHLQKYRTNFITYRAHMDDMAARVSLLRGDEAFLKAMVASGEQRSELIRRAIDDYNDSIRRFRLVLMTYYIEARQYPLLPEGVTRDNITEKLSAQEIGALVDRLADEVFETGYQAAAHFEDWDEYMRYIRRAQARVKTLEGAQAPVPAPAANAGN